MKLHITKDHTGKMTGLQSISTSCRLNPRCQRNSQIPGSICEKCYAQRLLAFRRSMNDPLEKNYKILTSRILTEDELPFLNCAWFRIEGFGDIGNTVHAINYLNLIHKNPQCFFGWWTKNPDFISQAIKKGYEKPKNCNIIRSSLFINKPVRPGYEFIDGVFTVYTKEFIREHNININCGARSCAGCHLCYQPLGETVKYINEIKK